MELELSRRGALAAIGASVTAVMPITAFAQDDEQDTPSGTPGATGCEEFEERVRELEEENERLRERIRILRGESSEDSSSGSEGAEAEEITYVVGEPFTVDAWGLTVTNVTFAPSLAYFDTWTARGVYVVVEMSVINNGNNPAAFPYDDLRIASSQGRTYNYASDVTIEATIVAYNTGIYDELQPGLTYQTAIVFDVPPDEVGLFLTTSGNAFRVDLGV